MLPETQQFIDRLRSLRPADDPTVVESLDELTDLGARLENPKSVYPAVFEFLEDNSHAELGEPGPLVHFLERGFPGGYESLLLKSLARKPTTHTVRMANRLLNSNEITLFLRSRLLEALSLAVDASVHDVVVAELAREYLQFQTAESSG